MSACIGEHPRVLVEKVQRHLPCGFRIGDRLSAVGLCVGPFQECPESVAGAVVPVASDSRIGELDSLTAPVISNVDAGVRQRLSAGLTGRGPIRRTERPVPFWSGFGIVIAPGWPTAFAQSGPSSEPKGPARPPRAWWSGARPPAHRPPAHCTTGGIVRNLCCVLDAERIMATAGCASRNPQRRTHRLFESSVDSTLHRLSRAKVLVQFALKSNGLTCG